MELPSTTTRGFAGAGERYIFIINPAKAFCYASRKDFHFENHLILKIDLNLDQKQRDSREYK